MKFIYTIHFALLLLIVCGCSQEDILQNSQKAGNPLCISATIDDYESGQGADVSSRASINEGITTRFDTGDDMGVFGIKNGQIVYDNVKFTLTKTGAWEIIDANGNKTANTVLYDPDMTYYAYAPYRADFNGCDNTDAIKTAYTTMYNQGVFADQSTKEKYNSADLLVSENVTVDATSKVVYFQFKHGMSLLKVYYNGDYNKLSIEKPTSHGNMYMRDGTSTYRYIVLPQNDTEVYGKANSTTIYNQGQPDQVEFDSPAYWQARISFKPGVSTYVTIAGAPSESYKTSGVDMGFPSGCVWANHNLGSQSLEAFNTRSGKWYDEDGNEIDQNSTIDGVTFAQYHQMFDRGDYYGWGELVTKYEQPTITFVNDNRSATIKSTTGLSAGGKTGYYPSNYTDINYTYAKIDGNISGSEHDVVRSQLWKGEWRLPNEYEVDELVRNSDVSIAGWYYEDNVRYAPWIGEKDDNGNYLNLHSQNSEFWGTANVRPFRYLVCIYKFVSKINGQVLYFPGGSWTDWSIDMLCVTSRDVNGNLSDPTLEQRFSRAAYGGMYYFASSASHAKYDCSSYMEYRNAKTRSGDKITNITPIRVQSSYEDKEGIKHDLLGLTQDGHRYTGMLIRPVYGGKNWNTNANSRKMIWISVE